MKIAVIALGATTVGLSWLLYQAVHAIGSASHTGYLVGWSERSQGKPLSHENFSDRILSMQKSERIAERLHRQMHEQGLEH